MAYPGLGQFSTFGAQNVYMPGYMGDDASQKRLMVGYTWNEEDFALNNYSTVFGADKQKFFYNRWRSEDFVRVPQTTAVDMLWADGTDRPKADEKPRFTSEAVELYRYGLYDFIGDMVEDYSDIGSLIPIMQDKFAARCMLVRALFAQTEITTSTNYPTGHYYADYGDLANDASTLGYPASYFGTAGTNTIADGTLNDGLIGKVIKHAVKLINRKTNGQVKPSDLVIVMNPNTADRLANSQEIRVYLAQQVNSIDVLQGEGATALWDTFGLPKKLYGIKVMVDPTVYTNAKQDHVNADTQSYVWADGLISIMARPGSVKGMPNSASFGSLAIWQHKKWAMKPTTSYDADNRRTKVMFEDMFQTVLVAPEATFTLAGCFTATV